VYNEIEMICGACGKELGKDGKRFLQVRQGHCVKDDTGEWFDEDEVLAYYCNMDCLQSAISAIMCLAALNRQAECLVFGEVVPEVSQ